jgi:hypothetical protein
VRRDLLPALLRWIPIAAVTYAVLGLAPLVVLRADDGSFTREAIGAIAHYGAPVVAAVVLLVGVAVDLLKRRE